MSEPIVINTGNEVSIDQIKNTFYLVASRLCQCGNKKSNYVPFCSKCTNSLPAELRNRLYLMIRRSFVVAYQEATEMLPKAEPKPCGCGCGEIVEFPWKFRKGHQLVAGRKSKSVAKPAVATPIAG